MKEFGEYLGRASYEGFEDRIMSCEIEDLTGVPGAMEKGHSSLLWLLNLRGIRNYRNLRGTRNYGI